MGRLAPTAVGGAKTRALGAGEFLFRQGNPATAIFAIVHGRLRLERHTYDGRRIALHTARAGEFFAEAALFAKHYQCDAVALEDALVTVHPKLEVLDGLGPAAGRTTALLAAMAGQLHTLRQRLELRNVRSARERVLLALDLRVADETRTVTLEGPLQELAADLGLTREVLYRTLATLERDGRIKREGNRIVLKRPLGGA